MNNLSQEHVHSKIPAAAVGVGLRAPHHYEVLEALPELGWLEVHSENFFLASSAQRQLLDELAQHYPLSFHGVGLSLGSTDPLSKPHLQQMKSLIDAYQPALISEHLSWSSKGQRYFNDLLPVPYTDESLSLFCDRVNQVQDFLGRNILIENPTAYLAFKSSHLTEWDFLNALHQRTQCGLLLDLNNIYVNSVNLGLDVQAYLQQIDLSAVGEIHLAGFTRKTLENGEILIDTHGSEVSEPVWQLFRQLRERCQAPALIEWDTDIPALSVLQAQRERALREQHDVAKAEVRYATR